MPVGLHVARVLGTAAPDLYKERMNYDGLMISVSGLRGRVGDALTPEVVAKFAAGFGAWAVHRGGTRKIVVGRDSRVSGPMFHRAALAALQSVGCHVIDVGVTGTPTVQLAVEHHHAAGGLAITASHNPIEWNALKFIGPSGLFLDGSESADMRRMVDGDIPRATWDEIGGISADDGAVERHIQQVLALPYVDVAGIRRRAFRVALDCVRGAGGAIMMDLLTQLGCHISAINLEPDGRFPRAPEPVAENLGELERLVLNSGSEIGFATDPDVDRLALVSEVGRAIGEDYTLALAARAVLKLRVGPVVTNLSTSRILDDVANEAGAQVIRAPVGEVNVATRMRAEGAAIGGEGNGGVILTELHLGRDAPVGVALILQMLLDSDTSLSEVVARYPRYSIVKDKLDRPTGSLDAVYATLRREFPEAEVDTQDGLRLSWSDRWVHVRPSGTEPIVRVIAEAPTLAEARDLISHSRKPLDALG
ncbi:MAG: phosphoglucosamine mutase [Anaerolineae bacterium]|nr:phosphoglucosamine mutase [Gemmatimonadaceae bacterium]